MIKKRKPNFETKDDRDIHSIDELIKDDTKIPWHFWLVVGLIALYLVFRFVQIIYRLLT
ncbi:MAG: hypothetical protein KBF89_00290 [Acidimicrobiia bacterium]|nr:hypothetical protein [Acidimicrobiia bacterium]